MAEILWRSTKKRKRKRRCPTFEEAAHIVYELHLPNLENGL